MNADTRRGVPLAVMAQALIESGAESMTFTYAQPKPLMWCIRLCGYSTGRLQELVEHVEDTHPAAPAYELWPVWECGACGHIWESRTFNRKRRGCPRCESHKVHEKGG